MRGTRWSQWRRNWTSHTSQSCTTHAASVPCRRRTRMISRRDRGALVCPGPHWLRFDGEFESLGAAKRCLDDAASRASAAAVTTKPEGFVVRYAPACGCVVRPCASTGPTRVCACPDSPASFLMRLSIGGSPSTCAPDTSRLIPRGSEHGRRRCSVRGDGGASDGLAWRGCHSDVMAGAASVVLEAATTPT